MDKQIYAFCGGVIKMLVVATYGLSVEMLLAVKFLPLLLNCAQVHS